MEKISHETNYKRAGVAIMAEIWLKEKGYFIIIKGSIYQTIKNVQEL